MLLFPLDYIFFGRPVVVEQFLHPRGSFKVKCLETLGSVSFLLSFIVMLKIAQNKEYFKRTWKPSSWGRVYMWLDGTFWTKARAGEV